MDDLFQVGIDLDGQVVYFEMLLRRLRDRLNQAVRNGDLTERGLARHVGLSQSHIHNVLKGARILSPHVADRMLNRLGLTVMDLLRDEGEPLEFKVVRAPARAEALYRGGSNVRL